MVDRKVVGMESMSDRAISRLMEYLANIGWNDKQINDLIKYIVKQ